MIHYAVRNIITGLFLDKSRDCKSLKPELLTDLPTARAAVASNPYREIVEVGWTLSCSTDDGATVYAASATGGWTKRRSKALKFHTKTAASWVKRQYPDDKVKVTMIVRPVDGKKYDGALRKELRANPIKLTPRVAPQPEGPSGGFITISGAPQAATWIYGYSGLQEAVRTMFADLVSARWSDDGGSTSY